MDHTIMPTLREALSPESLEVRHGDRDTVVFNVTSKELGCGRCQGKLEAQFRAEDGSETAFWK